MSDTFRARLTAGSFLLLGLAFVQAPGLQVADTKFDLVADPAAFLSRALHLWDPSGIFGQLQNQAYGYLWPMGPFFLLGDLVGAPGWAVQRAWLAVVMIVAFLGAALLARALGIRSEAACLLAGAAYALSPRMISTLGPISIEAWPSSLAPWVLLPLVLGASRGSAVRCAGLSALAIGMVGGVNAAATAAVLPLGAIWLLTRPAGARRRVMMIWWPVFTFLATAWWLVPLLLLGAYSPPFLDFIESAGITTFPATPFDVLRGSSAWVGYVDPGWGGGTVLVRAPYLALNSGIVLALGLAGLSLRGAPHRRFLLAGLLAGMLLAGAGHVGATAGWGAASVQDLLDGVLAPLRNVHKFDPVVRLPMVMGLAALVDHAVRSRRRAARPSRAPAPLVALAVLGVVGASMPAALAQIPPSGPVLQTPSYWDEAVAWLDAEVRGTTLYAPGTSFATYRWGSPRDEPFQYLDQKRWAVRNAVPLTPAGTVRFLDSIEEDLSTGDGSAGLARALGRAGIGAVVLRHDLAPGPDVPDPRLVRQALLTSPGITLTRGFGPQVGGEPSLSSDGRRLVVNGGWQDSRPALEVFTVDGTPPQAIGAAEPSVLVGGPEDLADALDEELLPPQPAILAADAARRDDPPSPGAGLLLTDGLQDRERSFGRVHQAYSPVRFRDQARRTLNQAPDFVIPGSQPWQTRARLLGAEAVTASGSASDAGALGGSDPASSPYAALDGDPATAWRGAQAPDGRVWWQVDLDGPVDDRSVRLQAPITAPEQALVRVVSDAGASRTVTLRSGGDVDVTLPGIPERWIRVEEQQPRTGRLSLSSVDIAGLLARRTLELPTLPEGWPAPDAVLLRRVADATSGCVVVDGRTPCRASQVRGAEERLVMDRVVRLPAAGRFQPDLSVDGVPGPELEQVLQQGTLAAVSGSSTGPADLRASALAAVDGDLGTTWTPALDDERPSLTVRWVERQQIEGLVLALDADAPARKVTRVSLVWPLGRREVRVPADGRIDLSAAPIRTDQLQIRVLAAGPALSVTDLGDGEPLPPGIGELTVEGAPTPTPITPIVRDLGCGSGPEVSVGSTVRSTAVVASVSAVYAGDAVAARICPPRGSGPQRPGADDPGFDLGAGATRVVVSARGGFTAHRLVLRRSGGIGSLAGAAQVLGSDVVRSTLPTPLEVDEQPAVRTVRPAAGDQVVVLRQNPNAGWIARQDGALLEPFAADGWQQGWRLRGDGPLRAAFAPDETYRAALGAGAGLAALLVLGLLVPARRWPRRLRRERPALDGSRADGAGLFARGTGALTVLGAAGLIAGWPSVLGAAVAGSGVALAARRRARRQERLDRHAARPDDIEGRVWIAPAIIVAAATAYVLLPWGGDAGWAGASAWTGHASVVAVCLVALLALPARRAHPPRPPEEPRRDPQRSAGTSTRR